MVWAWNNTSMAPKVKLSKRDAILNAMLDIVVERGFHDAPMSLLSQRSGASAGIIYHYFASKEDIILALYEQIRRLKTEVLLGGFSPDQDSRESFLQCFLAFYAFYRKYKREMRFYEQCEHAGFACSPERENDDGRVQAFAHRFSSKSKGGVLNEWPTEVLQELTVGVVVRLASQTRKLPKPLLLEVAERLWETVKAEE